MEHKEGWQSKEAAENYKNKINFIVPGRKEILETIAKIASVSAKKNLRVLDIGSGHGDVSARILEDIPEAVFTLVDYSEAMIESSRENFKGHTNFRFIRHDLNEGLPVSIMREKYDIAVSCFAIHHVEVANRVKLYRDIYSVLEEGSYFVNADMFKAASPALNDWEFDQWIQWMTVNLNKHLGWNTSFEEIKKRQLESFEKMGDKPGTIWDMAADFAAAGFKTWDCMFKIQNLSVMAAQK